MPIYLIRCKKCGKQKEYLFASHKALKYALRIRCECGNDHWEVMPTVPIIRFKGAGFYETDYKEKKQKEED